ncbi:MAG: hypothetical protein V4591_07240 [Bdellovibrionota bacterium]
MTEIKKLHGIPSTHSGNKLIDPYNNPSFQKNRLSTKGIPSEECFQQENNTQDFKGIYKDYGLEDFVLKGLTTEAELKKIHQENPTCIEALKEIPVVVALGIGNNNAEQKPKISIKDLLRLDSTKLDKIIYRCRTSEEVIEEVQSSMKLVPNTTPTLTRRA